VCVCVCVCVNNLHRVAVRKRGDRDSNLRPVDCKSRALITTLLSYVHGAAFIELTLPLCRELSVFNVVLIATSPIRLASRRINNFIISTSITTTIIFLTLGSKDPEG